MTQTTSEPESKVELVRLLDIRPCPENDDIYAPPSIDDPDILELIKSITRARTYRAHSDQRR